MNDEETVRKALKDKYMSEIVDDWIRVGKMKNDEVSLSNGTIAFHGNVNLTELVNDVANKFAEKKVDFWWETNIQKHDEQAHAMIVKKESVTKA